MFTLYVLLGVSVFVPIYTYVLYPLVLKLFRKKSYLTEVNFQPKVTVLICYQADEDSQAKVENIKSSRYPAKSLEIIPVFDNWQAINHGVSQASGEIIVLSDVESVCKPDAIANLVARFADKRIGCVCCQLRSQLDTNGNPTESPFWRYENMIKMLESYFGQHSGANSSLYGVRKDCFPELKNDVIRHDFFIATRITQKGLDVVMEPTTVVIEQPNDAPEKLMSNHIRDGQSARHCLAVFWQMLLPRKGSFVYVSHRVCKWIVPECLIAIMLLSLALSFYNVWMQVFLLCQILAYAYMWVFHCWLQHLQLGVIGKLSSFLYYFISLNYATFVGFLKRK